MFRQALRISTAWVAALALVPALSTERSSRAALADWLDSPVRYIATADEVKAFTRLADDEARARFVARFWTRRDPTPDTLSNEYRQLFWERVKEANEKFTDSSAPGWKTDRGKIFILYGPPDEIQEDLDVRTGTEPRTSRGLIRWVYQSRPGGRKDLDPVIVVPFVRDPSGEWRMSHDAKLASVFFDWLRARDRSTLPWDQWLERNPISMRSDLAVLLDQGRLQEVPSQEEFLLEQVETLENYAAEPLDVVVSRYRPAAADGRAVAVVTVGLPGKIEPERAAVLARFSPREPGARPRVLAEGSFRVDSASGPPLAQGRVALNPGTYDLTVFTADPGGVGTGLEHAVVEIPSPSGALQTSDVVLARSFEPLAYESLASYDEPFVVGHFRVVPRATGQVVRGEPVQVFFEVYGGTPPYNVSYRIEGKEDDGRWTPLGKPAVQAEASGAQGWSLPTSEAWPLADYRVSIEVTDLAGGALRTSVPFSLVARNAS